VTREALTWETFLAQLAGDVAADPAQLEEVLVLLQECPIDFLDKKRALLLWLDRAGLKLKHWMVRRLY